MTSRMWCWDKEGGRAGQGRAGEGRVGLGLIHGKGCIVLVVQWW